MTSFFKDPVKEVVKGTATTVIDLSKDVQELLEGLAKEPLQVLHVYSYSTHNVKTIKEKSCIPFKNVDVSKMKLSDVRALLVSEKILEPQLLWSAFCNQRGAKVLDSTDFSAYLAILREKSSEIGDITEDNADTYRVYLKSEKILEHDFVQTYLSRGVRTTIDKKIPELPVASQPKAAEVPTSFSHNIFMNPTTTFSIVHPADMSETQWSVVLRNNSLLHAYRVYDAGPAIGKVVERSMYSTFALKPRFFQNYQISASAASDSIAKQKQSLRIPRFRIEDDSYIEQFEKSKSVSRAISQSSLSQMAAELAVEGGAFGVSASLAASYSEDNSSSSSSGSTEDTRVMTITYNFPRVVIDFDRFSLDLSEECKIDLESVDSIAGIDSFKDKYGRFFPTRIELGGRLHSSEESTATTSSDKADQAKSMRAAAALSFSSPYVQASASASYGKSTESGSANAASAASKSVCWEAKGGDTLQCNDPPAWAYTVGSFYNWRAVKQSRVIALEDLITTIPGYQNIKQKWADIMKNETKTKPTTSEITIGFKLTANRYHKRVVSVEAGASEEAKRSIYMLAQQRPMTEERMNYLNRLSASIYGAAPLALRDSDGSDSQKFYINVDSTDTNDEKKLKYNTPYRIYNKSGDTNTWLASNPILQGYLTASLVWAGKLENATTFQFISSKAGNKSKYVQPTDEAYILLLDKDGHDISWASHLSSPKDGFGVDIYKNVSMNDLFYTVTYL